MIKTKNFQKIGTIIKTHGVKGELIVQFDVEIAEFKKKGESLFIKIDGYLVPFFLKSLRLKNENSYIVLFDELDKSTAEELTDKQVFISDKKKIQKIKEFNLTLLSGFILFDEKKMRIGEIKEYLEIPGNPNLLVSYLNTEILIPYNEKLVISVDIEKQNLIMEIPDGLLDLF